MHITLTVIKGPNKGRVFTFDRRDRFIVGRSKMAHFRLPPRDRYFSRLHFLVEVNPPHCRLMDMGSRNGTFVNGQEVHEADLKDGDRIKAGRTILSVAVHQTVVADTTMEAPALALPPAPTAPDVAPAEAAPSDSPAEPAVAASASAPDDAAAPAEAALSDRPAEPASASASGLDYTLRPAASAPGPQTPPPRPAAGRCRACEEPFAGAGEPEPADLFPASLAPICPACQEAIRLQPQPIADYVIVSKLGEGGMGVVSLALRKSDCALLAIKTIIPAVTAEPRDLKRFLREASILRDLSHPNIVSFQEMGTVEGRPYFAMDFVRGTDASRLVKENGPLPVSRAVGLVCQMLEALEYAHAKNYVHRDIKPANLLVAEQEGREVAKVADFGLARIYQGSKLSGVTLQGERGGTVAYMPPEQITNFREAKPSADQYSAGATLYNLLTNSLIYDMAGGYERQMLKILHEDPVAIRSRRPDLPEGLASSVHRALARAPENRFADVSELHRALAPYCR
jgi:serine/threonine-protein kinase